MDAERDSIGRAILYFQFKTLKRLHLVILLLGAWNLAPAASPPNEIISDMGRAMEYCQHAPLAGAEGIWEFPEDMTKVLIRKVIGSPYRYDIILISSPDCRLIPGEKIGEMEESADRKKLKLSLFSNRTKNVLTDMRHCAAEFNNKNDRILIHPRKVKFSVRNSLRRSFDLTDLLPKFWLTASVNIVDPASSLPIGLVRIFPEQTPSLRYL